MSQPPTDQPTFEQALAELEKIVRELEDGQTTLEESLARYERGVALLKQCYAQLQAAEQRILLLSGTDEEGRPVARPFQHAPSTEADKPDPKRRKKPDASDKLY
jgi:exodeoxyribonuclease VII small subunit